MNRKILIILFLIVSTGAIYFQMKDHEYVDFDDDIYFENKYVKKGLTIQGLQWAFNLKQKIGTYWHPLTWISLMVGFQIYGTDSGMQHLTDLLIHIINSILLFIVFSKMTNEVWKSAFIASMFALHPFNVETVAWITQRPNLLSSSFWLLCMWAYIYYTSNPKIIRYCVVLIIFTTGLLAKPTLITLPFVLLLIDYWPLKRIDYSSGFKKKIWLLLEKVPLFFVTVISMIVTIYSMKKGVSTEVIPVVLRIKNALVTYIVYIMKTIWPHNLGVYYPYPTEIAAWKYIIAGLLLASTTVLITWHLRQYKYLTVGWLWFLGVLLPVIGLVQMGLHASMADRYIYIPIIGLFIIISWGITDCLKGMKNKKTVLTIMSIAIVVLFMYTTYMQVKKWKNTHELFKHNLRVTENNHVAHNNFGLSLEKRGKTLEALKHYQAAISIKPNFEIAHSNIGAIWANLGNDEKALLYYHRALKYNPKYVPALINIGNVNIRKGLTEDANNYYTKALNEDENSAEALNGIGAVLFQKGEFEKASEYFKLAIEQKPNYKTAENNLKNSIMALEKRITND